MWNPASRKPPHQCRHAASARQTQAPMPTRNRPDDNHRASKLQEENLILFPSSVPFCSRPNRREYDVHDRPTHLSICAVRRRCSLTPCSSSVGARRADRVTSCSCRTSAAPSRLRLLYVLPAPTASCRCYPGGTPANLPCSALKLLWLNHLSRIL